MDGEDKSQVFINYRGAEMGKSFISHLVAALKRSGNKVFTDFTDTYTNRGEDLNNLFKRIEDSKIAIVVFSRSYMESRWCLEELVKINKGVDEGKIVAMPVFYKLRESEVRYLKGEFGDRFRDLVEGTSDDKIKEWKEALDSVSRMDGLVYNEKSDNEADFIDSIVQQVIRTMDEIEKSHDYRLSEVQEDASIDSSRSEDLKGSDAKMNADFLDRTCPNRRIDGIIKPPKNQVFINSCGKLRNSFISHLAAALKRSGNNVFIDTYTNRGEDLNNLFKRIEDSVIATVVFSSSYMESKWCLEELVKIKERVEEGKLVVIPVFYNLRVFEVRYLKGEFGDSFRDLVEGTSDDKIMEWKEALDFVSRMDGLVYNEKSDNEADFIDSLLQTLDEIEKSHDYRLSEMQEDASIDSSRSEDLKGSDAKMNADFLDRTFTNSPMDGVDNTGKKSKKAKTVGGYFHNRTFPNHRIDGIIKPPNIQVFINFRGDQLRNNFIGYLVDALRRSEINVFIDIDEQRGEDLNTLFKRIEDSGIAIVVFSSRYTESKWCLEELVKIKERVHQGLLKVLPIFYEVTPENVKRLKGDFGDHFRDKEYMYRSDQHKIKRWKEAIAFVSHRFALTFPEKSTVPANDFVRTVVEKVLEILFTSHFPNGK